MRKPHWLLLIAILAFAIEGAACDNSTAPPPPPADAAVQNIGAVYDVHSGSDKIGTNNIPYNEW